MLRKMCALELIVIIGVTLVYTADVQPLNILLFADTSTNVDQWPAVVDWARTRIHADHLLPDNYSIRWVLGSTD
jgi:hypothetical protein